MASYKQIIKEYSKYLRDITHIPQKEVEILLLHILQKNVIWLHMNYNQECSCEQELLKLVKKRATDYPLEYITKKASFYGEIFFTDPKVLIPRPETEILVELCEKYLQGKKNIKVLEIGTGSGIISVMLAKLIDDIQITAVDINEDALNLASKNANYHEVDQKIKFLNSNLFESVEDKNFDLVVSNPPYIANDYKLPKNVKHEPSNALFGGTVGDELLQKIILETYERKIPALFCEMGYDQKKPLEKFINENTKFQRLEFYKDYEKFDRGFQVEFS